MKKKPYLLRIALFYILSFTWALPTTLIGAIVSLFLFIIYGAPKKFGPAFCFPITTNGSGFELGIFFVSTKQDSNYLKNHELGHQVQAAFYFGPLQTFIVTLPSIIRYWLREMKTIRGKYIYAALLTLITIGAGYVGVAFGIAFGMIWLTILGALVMLYMIIIAVWLLYSEIPKYEDGNLPKYDDFWAEGMATNLGKKFMKDNYWER